MEEPSQLNDSEAFRESSLNSLVELQRFLAEELEDMGGEPSNLQRAFRPLTDGLGLDSPKRAESFHTQKPIPMPDTSELFFDTDPISTPIEAAKAEPASSPNHPRHEHELTPPEKMTEYTKPAHETTAALLQNFPSLELDRKIINAPAAATIVAPPPIPRPSYFQRFQAAIIDYIFVLVLWATALVLTANLLSGFTVGLSFEIFKVFSQPLFIRFAALEFATLWLSYFAVGVGLLDMTFGMWVWGIRIAYGEENEAPRFARKISRIVLSFFFFAPLLPSLALAFKIRGKNLLDFLSGTWLYSPAQ